MLAHGSLFYFERAVQEDASSHTEIISLLRGKKILHGKTTAFVCENGSCKFPTDDPMVFVKQIRTVKKL